MGLPCRRTYAVAALLATSLHSSGLCAAAPIPAAVFAAGPEIDEPRVSPDGTHLAFVTTLEGKRVLAIRDLRDGSARTIFGLYGNEFHGTHCDFKNDERLLCHFVGISGGPNPFPISRLVALNVDGKQTRLLFQGRYHRSDEAFHGQYEDRVVDLLRDDPQHVLIELASMFDPFPTVYRVNIYDGDRTIEVRGRAPITDWMADGSGVVRFGCGDDNKGAVCVTRDGAQGAWRTLTHFHVGEDYPLEPLAFGPQPNELFVAGPNEGRLAIWDYDLSEHRGPQLLFSHAHFDVEETVQWPSDGHIVGFSYETERPQIEFIDPTARTIDHVMSQAVPDTVHVLLDASRDGRKIVVSSYSDVQPPLYHLLDLDTQKVILIGAQNSQLLPQQLAHQHPIVITAADGLKIPGYLTLPLQAPRGARLPTIVLPHGGPYARDSWGYDPLVQLLANRGYAVLQVNFRGSKGFGLGWLAAGWQAWGTVMHEDITSGAQWLIAQGIADPQRMCIVGWSYGGYAALIGAEREPNLYRCAVSIAGVSDLTHMANDDAAFYRGRERALLATGKDPVTLQEQSPLRHAARIKVPVLLVHGELDSTVLVGHSLDMAAALARAGVPHELLVIKGGGHDLGSPEMRLTLYDRLTAFLGTHLGDPP